MIEHRLFTDDGYLALLRKRWEDSQGVRPIAGDDAPFKINLDAKDLIEGLFQCLLADGSYGSSMKSPALTFSYGGYRSIFTSAIFPSVVIKVERNPDCYANLAEFTHWKEIQEYPNIAKHYAPCLFLSSNKFVLVQKRADRFLQSCDLCRPDLQDTTVPAAFLCDDCHMNNFGFIENTLVCLDYSFPATLLYLREKPVSFKMFSQSIMKKPYIERGLADHDCSSEALKERDILRMLNKGKNWLK